MTAAIATRPELRQTIEQRLARAPWELWVAAVAGLVDGAPPPDGAAASGLILVFRGLIYLILFANCATFAA